MIINFDAKKFTKEMSNLMEYSVGFLDGINKGKPDFLENVGRLTVQSIKDFVDSTARSNPQMLHHIYEWYQTGSPEARLYDIEYNVVNGGLSINYTFSQSKSIQSGSKEPFYNKAQIMERGTPVTIRPKTSKVLRFVVDGQEVFTRNPVVVGNPGGTATKDGLNKTLSEFFNSYFSQAFMYTTGLKEYLENPNAYRDGLSYGKMGGRSTGIKYGSEWIAKAGKQ